MTGSLLGPLDYMFGQVLQLAIVVAALIALGVTFVAQVNAWTLERVARVWLFLSSVATIFIFTQHNPYQGVGRVVQLNPFSDLQVAVNTTGRYRDIVVANVLLFVPLGIALAWRGTRFVKTAIFATALSVLCEVLQYASNHGRVAQTGDVVVNLGGAVIGWAAFVALTGGWGPLSRKEKAEAAAPLERESRVAG
jgi:glycopeptide antibiotics resistance protein